MKEYNKLLDFRFKGTTASDLRIVLGSDRVGVADGKGLIGGDLYEMPLERKAPGVIFRQVFCRKKGKETIADICAINEQMEVRIDSRKIGIRNRSKELILLSKRSSGVTISFTSITPGLLNGVV